uniref:F-box protein AT5G49610-like beta-propeller domain-containing protein n=1 Tax=Aegilops tauschii TaxID=37682 RepID=M8CEI9_AEGTA
MEAMSWEKSCCKIGISDLLLSGPEFQLPAFPLFIFVLKIIRDCHDGYLVLEHIYTREALAYNPLTLALDLLPPLPDEFYEGFQGHYNGLDYHVHAPEECRDHGAFRVIYACHDDSRARAAVFSSDSDARAWRVLPYSEALRTIPESGEREHWLTAGRIVDGFVYWVYSDEAAMLVLDTTTLHFSRVDLPDYLKGQTSMFRVGKTRDGVLCVVVAIQFNLYVWLRNIRDDGVEVWVRGQRFQLDDIVEDTGGTLEEHGQLKDGQGDGKTQKPSGLSHGRPPKEEKDKDDGGSDSSGCERIHLNLFYVFDRYCRNDDKKGKCKGKFDRG